MRAAEGRGRHGLHVLLHWHVSSPRFSSCFIYLSLFSVTGLSTGIWSCDTCQGILYHVQEVLGFGTVRQFDGYYRFIVNEPQSILLLVYIFNGNLVLTHRQKQLGEWIKALNISMNLELTLDPELMVPKLSDAWLSGFTDAEGCFNVNIRPPLRGVQLQDTEFLCDSYWIKKMQNLLYFIFGICLSTGK